MNNSEKLLINSVLDHMVNAFVSCLHVVECGEIKGKLNLFDGGGKGLEEVTQKVFDVLYGFLLGKDVQAEARHALALAPIQEMKKCFAQNIKFHRGMRELDDAAAIFGSVASIVAKREQIKKNYDLILSFPYGGIELGFALNAYIKASGSTLTPIDIIHCHYSSKKEMRGECAKIDYTDESWMYQFVPPKHHALLKKLCEGNKQILLFDHNVTAFTTLNKSKAFCRQFGNAVDVAAISINYDNVSQYLVGEKSEPLCLGWRNLLDYRPTQEYVTAFNTWRTSDKSKHLEQLFYNRDLAQKAPVVSTDLHRDFVFKACRVHNPYDLAVVAGCGVNMIGVHAVFPDRYKYLEQQRKYRPLYGGERVDEDLPVATMEIESIRAMQQVIPKNMRQAILFEEQIEPSLMKKCCDLYGMNSKNVYMQLQYRTTPAHIEEVKRTVSPNTIIVFGLFQSDLEKYFWDVQKALNPVRDYVLLDMSKHQPDLISGIDRDAHDMNKIAILRRAALSMAGNEVPVILADDVSPKLMKKYLEILTVNDVCVAGIDMQNVLEIPTQEQTYQLLKNDQGTYHTRIRKSPDRMKEWSDFSFSTHKEPNPVMRPAEAKLPLVSSQLII
ncbi:MAG: hypothetical protein WC521_06120 [Bdellovibrionales bacterium]